jgi:hypothetical protein
VIEVVVVVVVGVVVVVSRVRGKIVFRRCVFIPADPENKTKVTRGAKKVQKKVVCAVSMMGL